MTSSIKEHYLYPLYLEYLREKNLSKGALELSKLSENFFFDFKYKYDTDNDFKISQDSLHTSIVREEKIISIIDDKKSRNNTD